LEPPSIGNPGASACFFKQADRAIRSNDFLPAGAGKKRFPLLSLARFKRALFRPEAA
jgi:hypothetical protein